MVACRYHGFDQPQPIGTFARAARLPASQLARDLNATRRPQSNVLPNCPLDTGEKYILHFSYASGRPLLVQIGDGGCRYVGNGDLTLPFASIKVTRRLEAALGQDIQ